jgi:hypothetical protein
MPGRPFGHLADFLRTVSVTTRFRASTTFISWAALTLGPSALASQIPEHQGEIEGVVRAADTGAPLAGSTVSVVGVRQRATTHPDGSFHLTGSRPR